MRARKPPGPTARLRAAKRRAQERQDRAVYAEVDARDGLRSRISGTYCARIHRHHIVPRSRGGPTTTANVVSLTPEEHLLHVHGTAELVLSGNADTRNAFGALCGVHVERRRDGVLRSEGYR